MKIIAPKYPSHHMIIPTISSINKKAKNPSVFSLMDRDISMSFLSFASKPYQSSFTVKTGYPLGVAMCDQIARLTYSVNLGETKGINI